MTIDQNVGTRVDVRLLTQQAGEARAQGYYLRAADLYHEAAAGARTVEDRLHLTMREVYCRLSVGDRTAAEELAPEVFDQVERIVEALGAALATAAVLWNSGGVTNVMFPFLMNFSLPIAALAAIWWHLDRRTVRHDVAASLWLMLALATSGLGLMTAVAVGVELVWVAVADRRVDWRRWLTLAPGPVLWLIWYLGYGVDSPASGGLRPVVSYAVRMIWGGFGSLVGGNRWLGLVVAAAMAFLIVAALVRRTFDGRIAAALAAPLAFAVLTAISRIGVVPAIPPDELRYQWTPALDLALGASNLTDAYPERSNEDIYYFGNLPYDILSGIGVNGAYWYARLDCRW